MSWFDDALDALGSGIKTAGSGLVDYFTSPEGITRLGSMGLSYLGNKFLDNDPQLFQPKVGYQKPIPRYNLVRERAPLMYGEQYEGGIKALDSPYTSELGEPTGSGLMGIMHDPNRRPGSSGRRYFSSSSRYVPKGEETETARAAALAEASDLGFQNMGNLARKRRREYLNAPEPSAEPAAEPMASGGIARLKQGRYLSGSTDGMADKVSATIEGREPAALSHGEFVIPADVVSHLGNGNSDAGANVLEDMMSRVRKKRTGTTRQGTEINPRSVLPS
jgi:hypothetical protein